MFFPGKKSAQRLKCQNDPLPQPVQKSQLLLCRLRLAGIPLHHGRPFLAPALSAADSLCKHIILQAVNHILCIRPGFGAVLIRSCFDFNTVLVYHSGSSAVLIIHPGSGFGFGAVLVCRLLRLILRQKPSRQSAPKEAEHTLVGEIKLHDLKRRADKLDERVKQNVSRLVDKKRDPVLCKRLRNVVGILWHVSGHHRKIPVTVALCPYQAHNLPCDKRKLLARIL